MAWKDNLLDATFKGIKLDVLRTRDNLPWATVEHAYPYRDGSDVEDLGEGARKISLEAVFFGDDYENRLNAFIREIKKGASGELVHPVFGALTAQLQDYDIGHEADNVDQATVTLQFIETRGEPKFFILRSAAQKAASAGILATAMRALSGNVLAQTVASIRGSVRRVTALRGAATGMLNGLIAQVSGVVLSGQDIIDFPRSFLTDVDALSASVVALWPFEETRRTDFARARVALSAPIVEPETYVSSASLTDIRRTAAHVRTQRTLAIVDAAVIVLTQESAQATLTPPQIERITGDARAEVQDRIDEIRTVYALEAARTLTEPLKDIALALQEAAAAVIEQAPPLIVRSVEGQANLHLLAHRWYGDYSRAAELLRLNPELRLPNDIKRGYALHGYAR